MIVKVKNTSDFAQIANTTLRDKRLDLDTRGALGEILSYSEDFDTSVESLMSLWNIGRDKLLKITNQLKEFGYLEILPVRDKRGRIVDKDWVFYGRPHERTIVQSAEKSNVGEIQDTEKPNVGQNQSLENPHDILKDESSQKYEGKDLKTRTQNARARNVVNSQETVPVKIPESWNEQCVWDYLSGKGLDIPIEYPVWEQIIEYVYARGKPASDITGCIEFLETDPEQKKWRKGRISAEVVMKNMSLYWRNKQENSKGGNIPDWQKAIDDCQKCDRSGRIEIKGIIEVCKHK